MKFFTWIIAIVMVLTISDVTYGRGGRLGGGGGGRGGGGGGKSFSRPSGNRSPSMSRPSGNRSASRPSVSRPSSSSRPSVSRPSGGGQRPSVGQRPSTGQRPSVGQRPSTGQRPSIGGGQRPSTGNRPSLGGGNAGRPSAGDLGNFLNLPKDSVPGAGTRPARPGGGELPSIGNRPGGGDRPNIGDRPNQLPNRPGDGDRPNFADRSNNGDRPNIGDRPGQLPNRPGDGNRPGLGDRPGDRPVIGDRPGQRPNRPGDGDRPGWNNRPGDRYPNRRPGGNHWGNNNNIINIGNNVRNRYSNWGNRLYGGGHWGHHFDRWGGHYNHWHFHWNDYNRGHWWKWATWGAVTGWFVRSWTQPYYYDYGNSVYYSDNSVYYGDTVVCSAEEYAQQATTIATTLPEEVPPEIEWMPLGVFALSQSDSGESNMAIQLAVSKEGYLAGTYYNTTTEASYPLEGQVDHDTQRAVWKISSDVADQEEVGQMSQIVMESGIYNLTKDQTVALVHFGTERTEEWLMVRLDPPEEEGAKDQPAQ